MSDFDEFERQLNENKQGKGAGGVGRRAAWLLVSPCPAPFYSSLSPSFQGRAAPPPPLRCARLAHVTTRRAAARGRGREGRGRRARVPDACAARSGLRPTWSAAEAARTRGLAGSFLAYSPPSFIFFLFKIL